MVEINFKVLKELHELQACSSIVAHLEKGNTVCLNMDGVDSSDKSFIFYVVGQLINCYPKHFLKNKITYSKLNLDVEEILLKTFKQCKTFFNYVYINQYC